MGTTSRVFILWLSNNDDEPELKRTGKTLTVEDIFEHACELNSGRGVLFVVEAKDASDAHHSVSSFEAGSRFRRMDELVLENVVALGPRAVELVTEAARVMFGWPAR